MNSRKGPAELARLARSKFAAQPADLLDIDALCLALGVVVRKASLQGLHGSLIKRDGQLTAVLNRHDSPRRQRFTLAHEIGHLLLHEPDGGAIFARANIPENDAERLLERDCDVFATELLMPRDAFSVALRGTGPTLIEIQDLGDRFGVSMESAALRVGELTNTNCRIVKWQHSDGGFLKRWAVGGLRRTEFDAPIESGSTRLGVASAYRNDYIVVKSEADLMIEARGYGHSSWRYVLSVIVETSSVGRNPRR